MSLSTLLSTPCTLILKTEDGTTDAYGNEIPGETLVDTTCSLQQRRRDEPSDEGELSVTLWALYLPSGTALDTGDQALVGNAVYEVVGQPWDATEGSTAVHHVEATLRKVAGAEDIS